MVGSPCTFWSIGQPNERETKAEGLGWELFKNYLIAKEKFKPDYFLYENNKSASNAIKNQISKELGVNLMAIDSALVSAQMRNRIYAFNWKIDQPKDRNILLENILESGHTYQKKSFCLTANYAKSPFPADLLKSKRSQVFDTNTKSIYKGYEVKDGKVLLEVSGKKGEKQELSVEGIPNGIYDIRKFSRAEMCRLQTLPDNYTDCVSWSQSAKGLGNRLDSRVNHPYPEWSFERYSQRRKNSGSFHV